MNELKPCPFCGGIPFYNDGFYVNGKGGTTNYFYVRCTDCKAKTDDLPTYKKAKEAWNRRS